LPNTNNFSILGINPIAIPKIVEDIIKIVVNLKNLLLILKYDKINNGIFKTKVIAQNKMLYAI
jgi:hypothetical protein